MTEYTDPAAFGSPAFEYIGPPLPQHAPTNRGFVGIPSLAIAPSGRLWATWYAGVTPAEDQNNYVILATSGDDGRTWSEILVVDPDGPGPRRTFDPEVWICPDSRLRWFWCDRRMPFDNVETDALWMMTLDDPSSEDSVRRTPVYVERGVMMCKPIVLSSDEWALPVSTWYTEQSARMVVSSDGGHTFGVRGAAAIPRFDRTFDEHAFVERLDGSIWCLARAASGIREGVSTDKGHTWPVLQPASIRHTSSRFFITRLSSGHLLLVKHGPIATQTGRSHLMAFISRDDGRSWEGGLLLDERQGVSYPDGQQAADGRIYVTYDFDRRNARQILFATFTEEDALAGRRVSDAVRLRQLISQGSGGAARD